MSGIGLESLGVQALQAAWSGFPLWEQRSDTGNGTGLSLA